MTLAILKPTMQFDGEPLWPVMGGNAPYYAVTKDDVVLTNQKNGIGIHWGPLTLYHKNGYPFFWIQFAGNGYRVSRESVIANAKYGLPLRTPVGRMLTSPRGQRCRAKDKVVPRAPESDVPEMKPEVKRDLTTWDEEYIVRHKGFTHRVGPGATIPITSEKDALAIASEAANGVDLVPGCAKVYKLVATIYPSRRKP